MTQFTQTSTLETNRRKIPRPRKGNFNYYPAKEGALKVKGYNFGEKDVVLDRNLEGFDVVNPYGITEETTVLEAIELLTNSAARDVSDLTDVNNLLSNCLVTTYAELVALRDASELIVGQNYLISDFAQSYNIFDGGTMHIIEEQIGIAEPIIVTASKVNELYKVAISTVYPQDIIHYSLDILDIRDIGFGNGVDTVNVNFKGQIYYRKDTIQNVETHYDFRNVKFRRWAVDAELYEDGSIATYTGFVDGMTTDITLEADNIGVDGNSISLLGDGIKDIATLVLDWNTANPTNEVTLTAGDDTQVPSNGFYMTLEGGVNPIAYIAKDVCKSGVDGKIYKCITATTGEGDPTVNTADWVLWLDITADAFVSWTSDKTKFNIGDITTDNLIINNTTAGVDYDDFYTFGDYYNWVKNVSIGMIDLEYAIEELSYITQLNNIVFKTVDEFLTCFGNNIGSNCCNNTIGNVSFSNTIGDSFIFNAIGDEFSYNTIGNYSYSNTIGNNFRSNTIGDYFYSNTIGNEFYSNAIGNDFNNNAIGNGFYSNAIGNDLYKTIFGNYCQYNTIANKINGTTFDKIITFGDSITMCTIQDFAFGDLAADLDLSAATHIRGAYNTTIYQDKTDGVKLSYMDGGVMQIVDVTD